MRDELIPDLILISHDHDHVATGHHRINHMSRTDESDLDFAREHGLRRLGGDDENRFHLDVVLAEKPLLLRDPNGRHIRIDGAVGKKRSGHRFCGCAQPATPSQYRQNHCDTNSRVRHTGSPSRR